MQSWLEGVAMNVPRTGGVFNRTTDRKILGCRTLHISVHRRFYPEARLINKVYPPGASDI